MRARTTQLFASLFVAVAVLATVGVCETRATQPARGADHHAAFVAVDHAAVAAPSVAPAPPHALPPPAFTITLAAPAPIASLLSAPRLDAHAPKAPLYLRDRALLL